MDAPDYLGVVDVNPESDRYGKLIHQTPMPGTGDELHHYGWQVCSSACHSDMERKHMIVPGFRSSRLHIVVDGRRLYATNSLYSTWDNQFYPGMQSWMRKLDCAPEGGMTLDERFALDFGTARGHEIHLPGDDCTTEIFP